MSYCSLEEAWGDQLLVPSAPAHGHTHSRDTETLPNHNGPSQRAEIAPIEVDEEFTGQFQNHELSQVIQTSSEPSSTSANSVQINTPPVQQPPSNSVSQNPWKEVSEKLDQLIMLLMQKHGQKSASWPDSIIYFLTGFFAILILWCFFSIGKWVGSKSQF